MLDSVLKNSSAALRISVKTVISVVLIALSVGLPQIVHIVGGATAGSVWLPMYAPVLLAGCLLGPVWGLIVGIISPIVSFGFTSLALDAAMPALARLPYMVVELAVFGGVSGVFSKQIRKNSLFAFPAVLVAQVSGRSVFALSQLIAGKGISAVMSGVSAGLVGLYAQLLIVPIIVIALAKALIKEDSRE